MDPGLAGITAYVSQDCTGMKDEPAVEKTGSWAQRPNWPFFPPPPSLCCWEIMELLRMVTGISLLCLVSIPRQTHPLQKSITSHSTLSSTPIPWIWFMFVFSTARAEDIWSEYLGVWSLMLERENGSEFNSQQRDNHTYLHNGQLDVN